MWVLVRALHVYVYVYVFRERMGGGERPPRSAFQTRPLSSLILRAGETDIRKARPGGMADEAS